MSGWEVLQTKQTQQFRLASGRVEPAVLARALRSLADSIERSGRAAEGAVLTLTLQGGEADPTVADMAEVLDEVYQFVGQFADRVTDADKWLDNIHARRVVHPDLLPLNLAP